MILLENKFGDIITESTGSGDSKKVYLSGIFLEAEQQNRNGRTYSHSDINKAVKKINEAAKSGRHILGELDHPNGSLEVKLGNVCCKLTEMSMSGNNGMGKAEIITTVPKGQIAMGLLQAGIQLGVSSRGSGGVNESTGNVEGFEITTIDVVANPSAINAFPQSIEESIQMYKRGDIITDLSEAVLHDTVAQKFFKDEIMKFVLSEYKL